MSIPLVREVASDVKYFTPVKHKTGLNKLPPELLARIFSYLTERERFYGSLSISISPQIKDKDSHKREIKGLEVESLLVCKYFEFIKNYCKVDELLKLKKFIELITGKIPSEFEDWRRTSEQAIKDEIIKSTPDKEKPDVLIVRKRRHNELICTQILFLSALKKEVLTALLAAFSKDMFQEQGAQQATQIDPDFKEFAKKIITLTLAIQEWYRCVQNSFALSIQPVIPENIAQNMHVRARVPKLSHTVQFIQPFLEYDRLSILKFLAIRQIALGLDNLRGVKGLYHGYLYASVAFLIFKERGLLDSVRYQLSLDSKILTRCIHIFLHELEDREDIFDKYKEETSHVAVQTWFQKLFIEISSFLWPDSPLIGLKRHSLLLGIAEKIVDDALRDDIYHFLITTLCEKVIDHDTDVEIIKIIKKVKSTNKRDLLMMAVSNRKNKIQYGVRI